jgi:hypothetical protein
MLSYRKLRIQLNDNFSDLLNEGWPDVDLVIGGNVNS